MRSVMRNLDESQKTKVQEEILSERRQSGDKLFEKWSKKKNIGEGMDSLYDSNPDKARGLSIILENQERHLKSLTETQLSSAFKTAPNNVIRVVRLGYPNSVRGDIFTEWQMETARDSIFYLSSTYGKSLRGATAGNDMKSSFADRYFSELEEDDALQTANGTIDTFTGPDTGNLTNAPLRPFTVKVMAGNTIVGTDDGAGNLIGAGIEGTVDYTSGAVSVEFATAPTAEEQVVFHYAFDSEEPEQYEDIGNVHLELKDFLFRARPWPLGVSWTKMTELLLGTTLDIDTEEALLSGAADELKKSLDYQAARLGYRYARGNTMTTFDADWAAAGADSEVAHAQSVTRAFDDAGDTIYNAIGRGGVTYVYGGSKALNFIKMHNRFSASGAQPKIGAHRIGELDGMQMFKVPSDVVPADEVVCVWKNENTANDSAIIFGTLVPLYQTQTLEFKEAYKETGLFHFGDHQVTNKKYMTRVKFAGLSA